MELVARRFDTLSPVRVVVAGERIARVAPLDGEPAPPWPESKDPGPAGLPIIAPGFVDIQVNGYAGQEFSSPTLTPEKVAAIVRAHHAFGVTRLCPTVTTQSFEVLTHGLRTIDAACRQFEDVERSVFGVHLEGPYFAPEDGPRGAHPLEHVRRPDADEFRRLQEASGGRIRLLTMAVEFDEAPEFIARVTAEGVVVAIGHTGANSAQIRAAVDAGARLSTHLGNGAHRTLRRHPNYLWDQLAEDRLSASLIVDGHHLPGEVVKVFVRAKTPARCILVSDVSGLAGLPVGRHASMGGEVDILPDGRIVIAGQDQLLAGASLPIGIGIAQVMRFAGVDLAAAVAMATTHPARLLGSDAGTLRPGDDADLVLFDLPSADGPAIRIRQTILRGRAVYSAGSEVG